MDKLNSILNIFSELNITAISNYIEKITDLYFRPVKVWRKVLSDEKDSINVFIFYILFYGAVIYLFSPDILYVIKFILIQLLVNLQPFLVLSIPFLFFTQLWKKKIKFSRLFRITFIFWLQIFPFVFIPIAIAEECGVESPFIISDNVVVLIDLLLIFVIPLLTKISNLRKTVWIITNYIVLNLFVILSTYIYGNFPDIQTIRNKIETKSPMDEFYSFESMYKDSDLYISDRYFILYYKPSNYKVYSTQYATLFLLDTIMGNNKRILRNAESKLTNLLEKGDTSKAYIKKVEEKPFNNLAISIKIKLDNDELISRKMLNQYREKYNKMFYHDLKLTDSLKSFAKFKGNKELFGKFHKLLYTYDKIYTDGSYGEKIVKTLKKGEFYDLYVDDGSKLVIIDIHKNKNNKVITDIKADLNKSYQKILDRFGMSTISHRYLYFPTHLLFKNKRKPINEQFKNIH